MIYFYLLLFFFVAGYALIIFEHTLHINKAGIALLLGVGCWTILALAGHEILDLDLSRRWSDFRLEELAHLTNPIGSQLKEDMVSFLTHHELEHHLVEIASIILFLLGAMTIVEVIDHYQGFRLITQRMRTTNPVRLLILIATLSFFMSALLDNLTTTIVMVTLLKKLLREKETRWLFSGMIIIAANAGGAWSPIGDVTTIMLWIGGQVTAGTVVTQLFLPSLINAVVCLIIFAIIIKRQNLQIFPPKDEGVNLTTPNQQLGILVLGVFALVFTPVFKTVTHLPPFLGMMLGVGLLWVVTDVLVRRRENLRKHKLNVGKIMERIDTPTVLFFLGILLAVAALSAAGHLDVLAGFLDREVGEIYSMNLMIGLLSAIVDNVPLVAAAMGMYDVETVATVGYKANFVQDGEFWKFLAYCAGTGGSVLIIGSAAGVAAMGLEKIDFVWYVKKVGWVALIGYLAGAGFYLLMV